MRAALLLALVAAAPAAAQDATRYTTSGPAADSVVAVARRLFDGMRAHDSTMIASVFAEGAMMTSVPRPGQAVRYQPVTGFIAAASRPGEPWDEQIYDPEVRIDGDLATLYVWYTFSLGSNLSHCGVDAIWLIRTDAGWKISGLVDTRQPTGCDPAGRTRVK